MNIFNVEDSLEEFDIQYMKAYNQVLNKYHNCTNSSRKQRAKSVSSTKKDIALSSPLLDKHTNRFEADRTSAFELLNNSQQSISPTSRVASKPFGKVSKMRPPMKPSVTIESIDTIAKPKHLSSPTSPKCHSSSKCASGVASFNSYVGNPFYKPSNTRGVKSMPSIPTVSSFNFNFDNTPQLGDSSNATNICHKKRKISTKSDMQLLVYEDEHPDPSISDASLSSFNSILSLNDNEFDDFNFDYFLSQENSDMFSVDNKVNFNDYYPFD